MPIEKEEVVEGGAVSDEKADGQDEFSKGFSKVINTDDETPKEQAAPASAAPAAAEKEKETISDEAVEKEKTEGKKEVEEQGEPQKRIAELEMDKRRLEGKIGELMMNKASAKKGGEVNKPKPELKDPKAMGSFLEEFPDVAPVQEEILDLRQGLLDARETIGTMKTDLQNQISQAGELATFNIRHPDHKDILKEEDFLDWTIEGGPSKDDYIEMKGLEQSSIDDRYTSQQQEGFDERATKMITSWKEIYPRWWEEKGLGLFSESSVPAMGLLDGYKEHKKSLNSSQEEQERKRKKRIVGAVTPTGSGVAPVSGMSNEEAFGLGFNKIIRQKM